ncbi:hypothetical protein AB838_22085 [Rhodobacteraceae bacterium (ex Bugula neritina AB1)]|nr:hypothetical protein AB838_22085 [Rhodobacteraceae bacterium (ex Bugula neritina AB1)]
MIRSSLKQIEAFRWAALFGSFKAAADHLHTTQPALSLRISKLEEILGTKLFEPGSRPAQLTEKGRELTELAEDILAAATRFEQLAIEPRNQTGVIRIGVAETIVQLCLADILGQVNAVYPNVRVDVIVDVSVKLREEMFAHKLDVCLMLGPVSDYRIENVPLCELDLAWVAHPDLDIPASGSVSEKDISRFPILTFGQQTRVYREIERHFASEGSGKTTIFASSSLMACQRMVLDKIGVACVPAPMARQLESEFGLRVLDFDWAPSSQVYTVSYPAMPQHPLVEDIAKISREVAARNVPDPERATGRT